MPPLRGPPKKGPSTSMAPVRHLKTPMAPLWPRWRLQTLCKRRPWIAPSVPDPHRSSESAGVWERPLGSGPRVWDRASLWSLGQSPQQGSSNSSNLHPLNQPNEQRDAPQTSQWPPQSHSQDHRPPLLGRCLFSLLSLLPTSSGPLNV